MKLAWNDLTAVFGGRFDPPHLGHRLAVQGLFRLPGIKRILILPSAVPPHKPCAASLEDRLAMVRLNFSTEAGPIGPVVIDAREIERAKQTGKPGYSFDTLQELRQEVSRLAFVVGADQFEEMETWYRFPHVLELTHWIVLGRRPNGDKQVRTTIQKWQGSGLVRPLSDHEWITHGGTVIGLFPTDAPDISSTQIRSLVARTGMLPEGALLPSVEQYMHRNHLYGVKTEPIR